MAGLDWFTPEAMLRAEEIYKSFHPEEDQESKTPSVVQGEKETKDS